MEGKEKTRPKVILMIIEAMIVLVITLSLIGKVQTGWMNICGYRVFYVMSGSMEPLIHKGQFVIGRVLSKDDEVEIGKVYAYGVDMAVGKEIIIHRLIDVDEKTNEYIFKGDANNNDDESVNRGSIGYEILCRNVK